MEPSSNNNSKTAINTDILLLFIMVVVSVQLTVCLDSGEFYPNFVGCAECSRTDILQVENRMTQQVDDEETVTYERTLHLIVICYLLLTYSLKGLQKHA